MSKGQGYKSAILVAESVAKQDYMDNYEVRVAEIERKKPKGRQTLSVSFMNIPHL